MRDRLEDTLEDLDYEVKRTEAQGDTLKLPTGLDTDFKLMSDKFIQRQVQKERDSVAKQVEVRLQKAFQSTKKPFELRTQQKLKEEQLLKGVKPTASPLPTPNTFGEAIMRMTDDNAMWTNIAEISRMPALEEQNRSVARAIQIEQKKVMKPIQKVLRAA